MKKSTTSAAESHGNGNRSETSNGVNPKGSKQDANLRKNGFIHFQIGLIVAMLLVYFGLEFAIDKLQPKIAVEPTNTSEVLEFHSEANFFEIEKRIVEKKFTEKVNDPDEFKIVDNDAHLNPNLEFKTVPVEENSGVVNISSINVVEDPEKEDVVVPFVGLEDAPIFPGCENVAKSERKACFEESIQKHVLRNFSYPDAAIDMLIQGKVYVMFTIGKEGFIEDVKLRGPAKILENEAARIIDKLPRMTPGKQRLQPVKVSFSLPIVFSLQQ